MNDFIVCLSIRRLNLLLRVVMTNKFILNTGSTKCVSILPYSDPCLALLQAPAIGCQWFSCSFSDNCDYVEQIASSRTFCIYEQVLSKCF